MMGKRTKGGVLSGPLPVQRLLSGRSAPQFGGLPRVRSADWHAAFRRDPITPLPSKLSAVSVDAIAKFSEVNRELAETHV